MAILTQNKVFGTLPKNNSNKFSKIALKVTLKIVLHDRIVILPKKIVIGVKFDQNCEKIVEFHDPDGNFFSNFFHFFFNLKEKKTIPPPRKKNLFPIFFFFFGFFPKFHLKPNSACSLFQGTLVVMSH